MNPDDPSHPRRAPARNDRFEPPHDDRRPGVVTLQPAPVPRPRGYTGPRGVVDAVAGLATERLPSGHLCGLPPHPAVAETTVLPRIGAPAATRGPSTRVVAWLLVVGGVAGLCVAALGVIARPGGGAAALLPVAGLAGAVVFVTAGAVLGAGVELPRRVGVGLQLAVTAAVVAAHGLLVWNLVALGALCASCLAGAVVAVPLFWYVTARALDQRWLPLPDAGGRAARAVVEHRRVAVVCWWAGLAVLGFVRSPWYEQNPVEDGTLGAVALVSAATVAGAWLASRYASRMGLWLSLTSALMMVTALVDIVPHVWHESEEVGTPLWAPALALVAGFAVVAFFTRGGCGHGHGAEEDHHADGDARSAAGGIGAAAALTVHRVVEGATLALTSSPAVIAALFVHSASEGLALAALFQQTRRSMVPWLAISVAGPALGVVVTTVSPLPDAVVPVLLALVAGVLLRTALVGVALVGAQRRTGQLRTWHLVAAGVAAALLAALSLAGGH